MKQLYVMTVDNFEVFFSKVVKGTLRAENYSRECFGMRDLILARNCRYVLEEILERIYQAGYDPYLSKEILEKYGDEYMKERDLSLKQTLDNHFSVDCSDLSRIIDYFNVAEDTSN